ncbi:LOW QUALITY PROTEIN: histone-lysine N-methyltransferase, H3 lysine-9 specific SUVH1-like [Lycium ferocissimum]|uniref:LOW QUALITY PROTEIN: histone-lysine N-methyltransferase, H3 lysine-9 specific SUVH1-like n=1 Tax=Lycium ferocissimum TaxID=112874 RepID=UPI0028166D65|nr:LOW QUALITY PROTEIN: histone-lysine N-methyltransferase, H3 lysine-9 specific SUVH1-like [Lycium ferocissimum]
MEQGTGSNANPLSVDKTRVLDVKPLRCLSPVFPSQSEMSSLSTPQPSPFVCVPPTGPFPSGVSPIFPFVAPNETSQQTTSGVPLNSGRSTRPGRSAGADGLAVEDDGVHVNDVEDSSTGKKKGRPKKPKRSQQAAEFPRVEVDVEPLLNQLLTSFKLVELDQVKKADGDKEVVARILLVFDLFRRRMAQIDESRDTRPDLKASNMLRTKGIRTNQTKRIGNVPGVEVGDIFFFRMELCIVGLHAPTMSGIDYVSPKLTRDEEPLAVSIVSAGGYDDDGGDGDLLVYTGQGGVQRKDGKMFDQKLEGGNLALEKSVHRANEVRVIRGVKDVANPTGKIYIYDGLYKVQESWTEKSKSECNVFKYKLVRVPGQPEAFKVWKSIQQWKDGVASRVGVILPDLTSGAERQPVCLVNDVDDEKGPAYFTYIPTLKYSKPFIMPRPSPGCHCLDGCQSGDSNCPCIQRNEGFLPYSSLGVLMSYKTLIRECFSACSCPPDCRNRISQGGPKVRLEVFKTKNRGWGLRSLDPIRGGGFICEYAGEVIDVGNDKDDNYTFDATRIYEPLEAVHDYNDESRKVPFPLIISAKNGGNIARFMNHSCSPNVYWKLVVRESNNEAYFHIAFFAIRHIPPMQELTYDYGINKADRRRKQCLCGSLNCRRYFH